MRRNKRGEHLDSRITKDSLILFRQGRDMLAAGIPPNALAFRKIRGDLHRALDLRPWMPEVFDFLLYDLKPSLYAAHAAFELVEEVHRRLAEAA